MITKTTPYADYDYRKYLALLLNILLGLTIVCVSFRILAPAIFLMFVSSVVLLSRFKSPLRTYLFVGYIMMFFCSWYLLGLNHFERGPGKFTNLVLLLVFSFILFFLLGYQDTRYRRKTWINFFCISSIVYVLIVCVYSFLKGYPGYNLVYDVINGSEENSPLYALQLVLFTIVWLNNNWQMRNIVMLTIMSLLCFSFSAVYLGSRAAFILLVLFFAFKMPINSKRLALMCVMVSSLILFLLIFDFSQYSSLLDFGGFSDRGIDSPRFSMLVYGFTHFLDYPFGGMQVQAEGYTGIWFHNMLLDLVRVSGTFVMFMWVLALLFTGSILVKYRKHTRYLIVFIILNIALMQDLAFDGFFNIMALEFYIMGHAIYLRNEFKSKVTRRNVKENTIY